MCLFMIKVLEHLFPYEQVCLRLLHPSVAECAWDTHIPDSLTHEASTTSQQPYQVRVQALAVLRNMVPNYTGFLRPSLPLLKKTLLLCLQNTEEAHPLWSPVLQFLDVFLPHLMVCIPANVDGYSVATSWWRDLLPPILHILRITLRQRAPDTITSKNYQIVPFEIWVCKKYERGFQPVNYK
ncbi:hypothetical protein AHF37_04714 [Paragonimus kellicotti]|nr:hypothetical protein AHF37_04714 [Paragonimus kellicotti]